MTCPSILNVVFAGVIALATTAADAETRIASWNVKRLSADSSDLDAVARTVAHFDLIALQEVMGDDAVLSLITLLQEKTGVEWGVIASDPIGRGSYKENYAFMWRKSHVEFVDSAIVYLDETDTFAREPLSARFRTTDGQDFIFSDIHVLYGDDLSDRLPEIEALRDYWHWLGTTFPNEQYLLAGDFNLAPNHVGYDLLKEVAFPTIVDGATTLGEADGAFVNLYDNIWMPNGIVADVTAGVFDLPAFLRMPNEKIRSTVSDHAPVYIVLKDWDEASGLYTSTDYEAPIEAFSVRANQSSGIYHTKSCPNYGGMKYSPSLVEFDGEEDALNAGFRKAENCPS
jgi:endonuclease/exonuclease/phosphatase family metal-dependent hydrolase